MSAAAFRYEPAATPLLRRERAEGVLRLGLRARGGASVLGTLYQQGCLKARFPKPVDPAWLEAVLLNVSGGVAGGDDLASRITLAAGARAIIASPAAERFYRALSLGGPARLTLAIDLAPGARLEWLPQESILFDGCAFIRRSEIALAGDARFLGVETLVFGRAAMGERLARGSIRDTIRLSRDGRLQLHEATRLEGAIDALLTRPATAAGAGATALMIYAAPDAPSRLAGLRAALDGAEAGASLVLPDLLLARVLAPTAEALRGVVTAGLRALRDGRMLPRVWQC